VQLIQQMDICFGKIKKVLASRTIGFVNAELWPGCENLVNLFHAPAPEPLFFLLPAMAP
jgi:hypothetical protein